MTSVRNTGLTSRRRKPDSPPHSGPRRALPDICRPTRVWAGSGRTDRLARPDQAVLVGRTDHQFEPRRTCWLASDGMTYPPRHRHRPRRTRRNALVPVIIAVGVLLAGGIIT